MTRSLHSSAYRHITQAVRRMRQQAGMTQRELARQLGRELSFVSRVEHGQRRLDLVEWSWICEAMGFDPTVEAAKVLEALKSSRRPH